MVHGNGLHYYRHRNMIKVGKNKVDMYRGFWTPNTYYDVEDMVFQDGQLWVANGNFTSSATFDEVNWTPLCCDGGGV